MQTFNFIRCIIFFIFLFVCSSAMAQEDEFLPENHEISIGWDFKEGDIVARQIGYHYMFCNYIGIGGEIGFWREMEAGTLFSDEFWSDNDYLLRLFIMPSVKFITPDFVKTEKIKLNAFMENGVMINRRFKKTIENTDYKFESRIFSYNAVLGVNLKLSEKGGLGVGYSFSTLEFSKMDALDSNNLSLKNKNMNGFFIALNVNL